MRIVKTQHGSHHLTHHLWALLECREQTAPPAGEDAEGVFNNPPAPGDAIVVEAVASCEGSVWVGLHEACPQRKSIIPQEEVGDVVIIIGQVVWSWYV